MCSYSSRPFLCALECDYSSLNLKLSFHRTSTKRYMSILYLVPIKQSYFRVLGNYTRNVISMFNPHTTKPGILISAGKELA